MDRYKLIKEVGDGTFGSVWRAINKQTGEVVAIKKMKKKYYSWDECINLREVKENESSKHLEAEVIREHDILDKKKSFVVKDTSDRAKENMMNQETERRDDSLGNKTQENKKQESHEQERNEEEVVGKAETIDEYGSSRKIHEREERKSDEKSEKNAEEETMDDKEAKEGNRAGAVLREVQTKIGKVREIGEQEKDKKQSLEADTSGKAKENKNQETKSTDNSLRTKTLENEKQESHEQKTNDEREKKNLGLVGKKTNCYRNEEDGMEDKEIAEAEVPRNLKGIHKRESTKMVDYTQELVEEKLNINQLPLELCNDFKKQDFVRKNDC